MRVTTTEMTSEALQIYETILGESLVKGYKWVWVSRQELIIQGWEKKEEVMKNQRVANEDGEKQEFGGHRS